MSKEPRYVDDNLDDIRTMDLIDILPDYFEDTGNLQLTTILNWRFDSNRNIVIQFFEMAEGYFETSMALLENCIEDNFSKKADIWIFPILFNVVHGIELYLKGFNALQHYLKTIPKGEHKEIKIEGKHNIKQLCEVTMALLKNDGNAKSLLEEMRFVQKFIEILYQNTSDMAFSRYPITAKGNKQFYIGGEHNITIDLVVFRQWVRRVYRILDSCTTAVYEVVGQFEELQHEMERHLEDQW